MDISKYVAQLKKVQILTRQEERTLWQAFKERGENSARTKLIEAYQPLVFKEALKFQNLENIMDIVQEGTVGLIEAVENYDHQKGVAFSLFGIHRIRGRMLSFLEKEKTSDVPCMELERENQPSMKNLLVDTSLPLVEALENEILNNKLKQALQRLPYREKDVLERIFFQSQDVKEVADILKLSTSHIYRLQKKGIKRIRGMLARFMHNW